MFVGSENFLNTQLEKFIDSLTKEDKLCVYVTTYNEVDGYNAGKLQNKDDTIEMYIEEGNMPIIDVFTAMLLLTPDENLNLLAIESEKQQAHQAHERAIEKFENIANQNNKNLLLVIYMGNNGIKPVTSFIKEAKQKYPGCSIIVAACDCQCETKYQAVRNNVDFFVVTSECGGYGLMGEIVTKILEC